MKKETTMQFANFNITFGKKEEPMLNFFSDIVYPAFMSNHIRRDKKENFPKYFFSHVKLKEIDGEYVLVGNYVKEIQYNVNTTIKDGELIPSPADIPSAPYSRFIIFLKNHRMILIKNESESPDIRSFQAQMKSLLYNYVHKLNKERKKEVPSYPYAQINIVNIPLKEDIETIMKDVDKINWVKLNFFPLNNDINPFPIAEALKEEMKRLGCNTSNTTFNSPKSKEEVQKMLEESAGLARTTMYILDKTGEKRKIKEQSFSSNQPVDIIGNIAEEDDEKFIEIAKGNKALSKTSDDNLSLYEKMISIISKLL